MNRAKVIKEYSASSFERAVDEFIRFRDIIDIQYSTVCTDIMGIEYSCLIIYNPNEK